MIAIVLIIKRKPQRACTYICHWENNSPPLLQLLRGRSATENSQSCPVLWCPVSPPGRVNPDYTDTSSRHRQQLYAALRDEPDFFILDTVNSSGIYVSQEEYYTRYCGADDATKAGERLNENENERERERERVHA